MNILLIGLGGFLGAISRYIFARWIALTFGNLMPYGTLFVNVAGSFLLGYLYTLSIERIFITEHMRFFLGVGFLGAFTTFSTFSLESIMLYEDGAYILFFLNILLNLFLSLLAVFFGIYLAK